MVNVGRIHRELGKFLMISSHLIKSDDELVIEIGENGILWKRTWQKNPHNQKSKNLTFIL